MGQELCVVGGGNWQGESQVMARLARVSRASEDHLVRWETTQTVHLEMTG